MSQRIDQLNALIQQEVAAIVERDIERPEGVLVTISRASVADDAESAKVWISTWPFEQGEMILKEIERNIISIQDQLNKKLVMKFVPKLRFALDDSEEKAKAIHMLLDQVAHDPTLTPVPPVQPEPPAAA
jgi:ribosome-binding factor A